MVVFVVTWVVPFVVIFVVICVVIVVVGVVTLEQFDEFATWKYPKICVTNQNQLP